MNTITSQLVVSRLTKRYDQSQGPVTVLNSVSFSTSPGQALAIIGPSGSGKSTLLNIIGSLDQPSSGTVHFDNTDVTALTGRALAAFRATQVGFVFQDHRLLPQLTALENVLLPTLAVPRNPRTSSHARELLDRVGVLHRADAFPSEMSGGERQRVAIARALINGARLLLCDEPTGNLDHETARQIVDLFFDLAVRNGVILLMVTHNLELASRMHHCFSLRSGALISSQKSPLVGASS